MSTFQTPTILPLTFAIILSSAYYVRRFHANLRIPFDVFLFRDELRLDLEADKKRQMGRRGRGVPCHCEYEYTAFPFLCFRCLFVNSETRLIPSHTIIPILRQNTTAHHSTSLPRKNERVSFLKGVHDASVLLSIASFPISQTKILSPLSNRGLPSHHRPTTTTLPPRHCHHPTW
jgi:hypothetical protein